MSRAAFGGSGRTSRCVRARRFRADEQVRPCSPFPHRLRRFRADEQVRQPKSVLPSRGGAPFPSCYHGFRDVRCFGSLATRGGTLGIASSSMRARKKRPCPSPTSHAARTVNDGRSAISRSVSASSDSPLASS